MPDTFLARTADVLAVKAQADVDRLPAALAAPPVTTTALRLRDAEHALTDAQHVAQAERERLSAPKGAAAGVAEARRRAGLPADPLPDVTISPETSAAVTTAETAVAALRAEMRAEAEARWTHDIAAGRAEAQRRVAARSPQPDGGSAEGMSPAGPSGDAAAAGDALRVTTAADGRAEARRRFPARGDNA